MANLLEKLGVSGVAPAAYGLKPLSGGDGRIESFSPIDSASLGVVEKATRAQYDQVVAESVETFIKWRSFPAPKRGEVVRQIGNELRVHREDLGRLVSIEMGKIHSEGVGEVQEAIDIADFAVGLSRCLYGMTTKSERPDHCMYEQWHPLGPVGVITAFNFPVAVWAWNAMIAAVCGDTVIWKPSEITPLTAIATHLICSKVAEENGFPGLFSLVLGERETGEWMTEDSRMPLISATGSCRMGRAVGETVSKRLGKTILELGGNNAVIVLDDADLELVVPAVLFGAVGTAGQRCTSTRRLLVQKGIRKKLVKALVKGYKQIRIGNPLEEDTLMGPLIHDGAVKDYLAAIDTIREQGGEILFGGEIAPDQPNDLYVLPTIVAAKPGMQIIKQETFAPILYVIEVSDLEEAVVLQNDVPQGLSSAIFTSNMRSAQEFLCERGSDCGIANVNIGTSGAEIGGAFGGEKDTGGGRESGSDSWKQYMRRQTNTINYGTELPLAQGVKFEI